MTATYVCVTGASSGIGLELAKLFAADRRNLILVARRKDKLEQLANQLSSRHNIEVHSCPLDLAKSDAPYLLSQQLGERDLKVDTLVNNAGFGLVGAFADLELSHQLEMLAVNVRALTELTHRMLPAMLASQSGNILNVASVAAYQPGPYMAVYYASKAFVLSFSHALRTELSNSGINVTCLAPGPTSSEFGSVSGLDRFRFFTTGALSAAAVAKSGYQGLLKRRAVVIPGARNTLMVNLVKHLPHSLTSKIVARIQHPQQ